MPGEFHGRRSLGQGGYSPSAHKESDTPSDQHFHFFQLSNANVETVLDFKGSESEDIEEKSGQKSLMGEVVSIVCSVEAAFLRV